MKRRGWTYQRNVRAAITRELAAAAKPAPVAGPSQALPVIYARDKRQAAREEARERLRAIVRETLANE